MDKPGIEPGSQRCERRVFPLDDKPAGGSAGSQTLISAVQTPRHLVRPPTRWSLPPDLNRQPAVYETAALAYCAREAYVNYPDIPSLNDIAACPNSFSTHVVFRVADCVYRILYSVPCSRY